MCEQDFFMKKQKNRIQKQKKTFNAICNTILTGISSTDTKILTSNFGNRLTDR